MDTAYRGLHFAIQTTKSERRIDIGTYLRGFRVLDTTLRNDAPDARFVEYGKVAGSPGPPLYKIKAWAMRKLGLVGKELDTAAWRIRNAIQRRGIKPGYVLKRTYRQMNNWIVQETEKRLRRAW